MLKGRDSQIPGAHWSVSLAEMVEFWFSESPCFKGKNVRELQRMISTSDLYVCVHIPTQ